MKKILTLALWLMVALNCMGATYQNWATSIGNPSDPSLMSTNVAVVSTSGNDGTGKWGNTNQPFLTPRAAVKAAPAAGGTIKLLPGVYDEGSNIMGFMPKNTRLVSEPLWSATISYWASNSTGISFDSNNCYAHPGDNCQIVGVHFTTTSSNGCYFYYVGTTTNSPAATNVYINVDFDNATSDGMIFASFQKFTALIDGCDLSGPDDVFVIQSTVNTNDFFHIRNFRARPNLNNGVVYGPKHGLFLQGQCNIVLDGIYVEANKTSDGPSAPNTGIDMSAMKAGSKVSINEVVCNDAGINYADVVFPDTGVCTNNWSGGRMVSIGTNPVLNVWHQGGPSLSGLPGYPLDYQGQPNLFGALTIPMNISVDPADGTAQTYGQWQFYDAGTNGTLLITNISNPTAANGGSAILFQPDDGAAAIPVAGQMRLIDMSYAGNGSGITNLIPAPSSGVTNIVGETANGTLVNVTTLNANGNVGVPVYTNWVLGGKYTFPFPAIVTVSPVIVTAGVSGNCCLAFETNNVNANNVQVSTVVASLASTSTNSTFVNFVPANVTFDFTNRSTGAGDSATVSGGQYMRTQ